jgi:hypothetical protein
MTTGQTEWEYLAIGKDALEELSKSCEIKPKTKAIFEDVPTCSGLNQLGHEGWELVSVVDNIFYFKKPVKFYENF